jgi:hypothetical protein
MPNTVLYDFKNVVSLGAEMDFVSPAGQKSA